MVGTFGKILSGRAQDRIDAEKAREEAVSAALKRWFETGLGFTHAGHQKCIGIFTLRQQELVAGLLVEAFPALLDLPYVRVREIIQTLSPSLEIEGAVLFATQTREAHVEPEADTQIPFGAFLQGFDDIGEEGSDEQKSYLAAVGQIPLLQPVFMAALELLASNLVKQCPELDRADRQLDRIVSGLMVEGLRLEFLCTRLIHQQRESDSMMEQFITRASGGQDMTREEALVHLMGGIPAPDEALPWPLDHQCLCGVDLGPFIFCCDHKKPLDPAAFESELTGAYLYKTPCCGETFSGFRCDRCGRLYTWIKGVVRSVVQGNA